MELRFTFFIIIIISLFSCKPEKEELNIIYVGHCYRWHEGHDKMDKRIEAIDYKKYDEVWLGGDIFSEVTAHKKNLHYIDSIFDIGSPTTHWSLGNHDTRNGRLDWITEYTKRKTFYTTTNEYGLTKMVLNVCYNNKRQVKALLKRCDDLNEQYEMIKNVTDTITKSSYLIVLVHGAVWSKVIPPWHNKANLNYGNYLFNCFDSTSTFKNVIYPKLVNVRKRGVKVVCLAGDFGQNDKAFQYTTKEDITFLGSGINNSIMTKPKSLKYYPYVTNTKQPDSILTLKYNIKEKNLTWKFHKLNDFVNLKSSK